MMTQNNDTNIKNVNLIDTCSSLFSPWLSLILLFLFKLYDNLSIVPCINKYFRIELRIPLLCIPFRDTYLKPNICIKLLEKSLVDNIVEIN